MCKNGIQINDELRDVLKSHLRLLTRTNSKKKFFQYDSLVSGYSDVMFQVADIIKVCILALEAQDYYDNPRIPEPNVNISGVLSIALNMMPYEEMDLLDTLYDSLLEKEKADAEGTPKETPVYNFSTIRTLTNDQKTAG